MRRKARPTYPSPEEYARIMGYLKTKRRSYSNFAVYAMISEISKTEKRAENRAERERRESIPD